MPELPTPGVNGQVLSAPALQASMSILSFAPATSTSGCATSTASAGSFCLFCENGEVGLPTLTRTSAAKAPPAKLPAPVTTDAPSSRTLMIPVTLNLPRIAVLPLVCPGNGSPLVYCGFSDLLWLTGTTDKLRSLAALVASYRRIRFTVRIDAPDSKGYGTSGASRMNTGKLLRP